MNVCTSFDGTQIAYRDEGQGPPAILWHEKVFGFLKEIRTALAQCEGDHRSTGFQPTFHRAVVEFFHEQWRLRATSPR